MEKYMVLRFRNAKLFRNKKTKDKVFDDNERQRDRRDIPWFVEAITVHHISNMLHVLLGERPVPTVRNAMLPYGRNEEVFGLAQESYMRIDSLDRENKDGKREFIQETVRLKKSMWNAWHPQPLPVHWEKIRRVMGDVHDDFCAHLKVIFGKDQTKRPFRDVLADLQKRVQAIIDKDDLSKKPAEILQLLRGKDKELVALIDFLIERKKSGFSDAILKPEFLKQLNAITGKCAVTIVNGVDNAAFLSGCIYVPVNDQWLERISANSGNATILDGGMVWIDSVRDIHELNLDGFRKMSEVSLETY